jgi:hypothetical protein
MSELADALKQYARVLAPETDLERPAADIPLYQLSQMLPAIIATLEDHDRLRAAGETVQAELVRLYRIETAAKRAVPLCARVTACGAVLRAALEETP